MEVAERRSKVGSESTGVDVEAAQYELGGAADVADDGEIDIERDDTHIIISS